MCNLLLEYAIPPKTSNFLLSLVNGKGKAVPVQSWTGPEDSKRLTLTDFKTMSHEDGKVFNLPHRPLSPPGNIPGTQFC